MTITDVAVFPDAIYNTDMNAELTHIFEESAGSEALRRVIHLVRPAKRASVDEIDARIEALTEALADDPQLLEAFDAAVLEVVFESRLAHAFADGGILEMRGFFAEFRSRLARRVLPRQSAEDAARHHILEIFEPRDWRWVTGASLESWIRLFELIASCHAWAPPRAKIDEAMTTLAHRIGAMGVDEEFQFTLARIDIDAAPFVELTGCVDAYLDVDDTAPGDDAYDALGDVIDRCRCGVDTLRDEKETIGTTLRLTRATRRLRQQLDRLELLAELLHPGRGLDTTTCAARLFRTLVEAESTAISLSRLVSKSTDLLAHQVAEQGARKGQKYITDTTRGYFHFLRAALQGGAIVAPFAILKVLMVRQDFPVGVEALLFSINYAVCFTLLYVTGSILATKQPAVTASAVARKIDEASSGDKAVEGVADVVVLVWRSQFVSFLGNLAAAIPLGILIGWTAVQFAGVELADTDGAHYLLDNVHPWASATLLYAAIAGICLFLSGLVGGAVDNHVRYTEVPRRLREHRGLGFLGDSREAIADFVSKHLGMISGNVVLGFMLGCAGPLGVALGLPLDIRHIAFSSAEVGLATYTLPEITTSVVGAVALMGVLGIGFFNFLICFLLTLGAGLDARGLTFVQVRRLVPLLIRRALTRPWEWFIPTKTPRYELPEGLSQR